MLDPVDLEGFRDLDQELEVLQSSLKHTQDRVASWRKDMGQLLENANNNHEANVKGMLEQKEKYRNLVAVQQKENVITSQKLGEKCAQLEKLKTELEKLYTYSQELHAAKAKGTAENVSLNDEIEQLKKDIAVPTQAKQKLEYLNKASGIFSNMLGLSFKKTKGNRIQVNFTHIDERDPLMVFYFFLQIEGAGRRYVVADSEPPVEGLDELVEQLNETNNLRQFMIAMRNKFRETLKNR